MCFNDHETNKFEPKKFLIDTEIRTLEDVDLFLLKYFKPTTGENYLFMKLFCANMREEMRKEYTILLFLCLDG